MSDEQSPTAGTGFTSAATGSVGGGGHVTSRWGEIATQVAQEFGLDTHRSPTLKSVIERGVRYITVDTTSNELVFDMRALVIGFILAGQDDGDSIRYGNTASWFSAWLLERYGSAAVANFSIRHRATAPDAALDAFRKKFSVVLSSTVKSLLNPAAAFALATVGRRQFEARHLFAAMTTHASFQRHVTDILAVKFEKADIEALRASLTTRITATAEPGETLDGWQRAFSPNSALQAPRAPASYSIDANGMPPFANDTVGAFGSDLLGTDRDAVVLARLICLENAAPLAVAILGGWGAGKSTFMAQIEKEVQILADQQSSSADPASRPSGEIKFVSKVVHVRFNAWQFVDANLWASLTGEFFDQLRAGGWDHASKARYAGLVSEVNSHVHTLNVDLQNRRRDVSEAGKVLLRAQTARDEAIKGRGAGNRILGQAALDQLNDLYQSQRTNLSALGMGTTGNDSAAAVDTLLEAVKNAHSLLDQIFLIAKILTRTRIWLLIGAVVSALIIFGLVCANVVWSEIGELVGGLVIATLTSIGVVAGGWKAVEPAVQIVLGAAKKAGAISESVREADKASLQALVRAEINLRAASDEAEAQQAAVQENEQRLARYIDPEGSSNPPRLLRYILEDDPNTKALQGELGLIGRTRRLFQAVDDIVAAERKRLPSEKKDLEVPDRIVLYIDDLDRCSEKQVYAVLQALHLLLAFPLFVVVAGVDVAWVQAALAESFDHREKTQPGPSDSQRAARYLEKIFQVAFWLNPLTNEGPDGGSYARYIRDLTEPKVINPAGAPRDNRSTEQMADSESPLSDVFGQGARREIAQPGGNQLTNSSMARPAPLTTIELESAEIEFLASAELAAIGPTTPRSVKRLINTYRLVRSRLAEGGASIMGDGQKRPIYPLIALCVAIETGPSIKLAQQFFRLLSEIDPMISLAAEVVRPKPGNEMDAEVDLALSNLSREFPELASVVQKIDHLRQGDVLPRDLLDVARVARRYSFNRC